MRLVFWGAFWAFLLDQASKYYVVHWLGLSRIRSIDVLPPILNFRYGENTGINFGLFGDESALLRWGLIVFSGLVAAAVWYWTQRQERPWTVTLSAGILIGGALGNMVDRIIYGYVLDFLNTSCCGISNPFVFNLADVFIFGGAFGIILFDPRETLEKAGSDKAGSGRGRQKGP